MSERKQSKEEQQHFHHQLSSEEYLKRLEAAFADEKLAVAAREAADSLERDGFAVIPNLLTADECEWYEDEFWRILKGASKGKIARPPRSGRKGGGTKELPAWVESLHGILTDGEWGHIDLVHALRAHPRVYTVFSRLYGDATRLTCSIDRLNYQLPPEFFPSSSSIPDTPTRFGSDLVKEASWLHLDQAMEKEGRHCIQGFVQLTAAEQPGDASLEIVARSHLAPFEALRDGSLLGRRIEGKAAKTDWYKLTEEDKRRPEVTKIIQEGLQSVRAPAGSLVLFDSRCLHQGGRIRASPQLPRAIPRPRFAVYVTYQPLLQELPSLPSHERKKKEEALSKFKATNHWPLAVHWLPQPRTSASPWYNLQSYPVKNALKLPVLRHIYGIEYQVDAFQRLSEKFLREQGDRKSVV